jgi:flagellum-specific peptidoglycan hydrolase FlgJ
MIPTEFFSTYLAAAQATAQESRIPPSFTLAQAAIESGWGASTLSTEDFNFFGVKSTPSWTGEVVMRETQEFLQGHMVTITAPFRKYADVTAGFEDHAAFLTNGGTYTGRYAPAFQHCDDSCAFAQAVADAGYATDPNYAQKIIMTIHAHGLQEFANDAAYQCRGVPAPSLPDNL